jgi:hypothetical protein
MAGDLSDLASEATYEAETDARFEFALDVNVRGIAALAAAPESAKKRR